MTYQEDQDLAFLAKVEPESLNNLALCLTHFSQCSIQNNSWKSVVAEFQNLNASMKNQPKEQKTSYKESLMDICNTFKVNYDKEASTSNLESRLILKILSDSIGRLTQEETTELKTELDIQSSTMTAAHILSFLKDAYREGKKLANQISVLIANTASAAILGQSLNLNADASTLSSAPTLTKSLELVLTSNKELKNTNENYFVAIVATLVIAVLRQQYYLNDIGYIGLYYL